MNEHSNRKRSARNKKYITALGEEHIRETQQSEENKKRKNNLKFSPQRSREDGDKKDKRFE